MGDGGDSEGGEGVKMVRIINRIHHVYDEDSFNGSSVASQSAVDSMHYTRAYCR